MPDPMFWDSGIGGLRAVGIKVTDDQCKVLEEGGEVLFIRNLLSPWYLDGDYHAITDQNGEWVFIPARLHATFPAQRGLPVWQMGHETVASMLNEKYAAEWRSWPSYVGVVEEQDIDQRDFNDGLAYVRVWDGMPLLDGADHVVAEAICDASRRRIEDSSYQDFCLLYEFTASTPFDLDDIEVLSKELEEGKDVNEECAYDDLDPDYVLAVVDSWRRLSSENRIGNNRLDFKPMDHYLADNPVALSVWNRLYGRKKRALFTISRTLIPGAKNHFMTTEMETI